VSPPPRRCSASFAANGSDDVIYLDSSALLKLIHPEAETPTLRQWLATQSGIPVVSSVLARIEVTRACRQYTAAARVEAAGMFAGLDVIPLSDEVVTVAGEVGEPTLRSLDAIHLASALAIRAELSAVCVYDRKLFAASESSGLAVVSPGTRLGRNPRAR
jgi:predicted nucleic acid-binding protein